MSRLVKVTGKVTRDTTLFVLGLVGIANEAYRQGTERPTLLLLFAAMIGLPAFLAGDRRREGGE